MLPATLSLASAPSRAATPPAMGGVRGGAAGAADFDAAMEQAADPSFQSETAAGAPSTTGAGDRVANDRHADDRWGAEARQDGVFDPSLLWIGTNAVLAAAGESTAGASGEGTGEDDAGTDSDSAATACEVSGAAMSALQVAERAAAEAANAAAFSAAPTAPAGASGQATAASGELSAFEGDSEPGRAVIMEGEDGASAGATNTGVHGRGGWTGTSPETDVAADSRAAGDEAETLGGGYSASLPAPGGTELESRSRADSSGTVISGIGDGLDGSANPLATAARTGDEATAGAPAATVSAANPSGSALGEPAPNAGTAQSAAAAADTAARAAAQAAADTVADTAADTPSSAETPAAVGNVSSGGDAAGLPGTKPGTKRSAVVGTGEPADRSERPLSQAARALRRALGVEETSAQPSDRGSATATADAPGTGTGAESIGAAAAWAETVLAGGSFEDAPGQSPSHRRDALDPGAILGHIPSALAQLARAAGGHAPAEAASAAATSTVLPQIVQGMRVHMRNGMGEARIQLQPEHLGGLTVALRLEGGQVTATFRAETPAVRQWLEGHQQLLRDALAEQGLELSHFTVNPDGAPPERERQEADATPRRRYPRRSAEADPVRFEVLV